MAQPGSARFLRSYADEVGVYPFGGQQRREAPLDARGEPVGHDPYFATLKVGRGPLWGPASLLPGAGLRPDSFTHSSHREDSHKG